MRPPRGNQWDPRAGLGSEESLGGAVGRGGEVALLLCSGTEPDLASDVRKGPSNYLPVYRLLPC